MYLIHCKPLESCIIGLQFTAIFSLVEMKLAAMCILQLFSGCRYQTELRWHSWYIDRPQVWQLRHLSLIPSRGRDFFLLQSACASSGSHPASCSVGVGVAWHEADHSWPFTVVLRLNVCVELNLHFPECLHDTHRNNFTDTRLHWKYWIRFLSKEWLLHTYCWVHLASAILGHKWPRFSSLNWWIGCCIFLWVCMNPSSF